jgi:lipoprotein-anchoring transpeptidase ErfK/SrfK
MLRQLVRLCTDLVEGLGAASRLLRKIGYRESHGCVRLTNWDVLKLAALVKPGTSVIFER